MLMFMQRYQTTRYAASNTLILSNKGDNHSLTNEALPLWVVEQQTDLLLLLVCIVRGSSDPP